MFHRFIPKRSLDPEQIYVIVEQFVFRLLDGVAGYVENKQETKCQPENER